MVVMFKNAHSISLLFFCALNALNASNAVHADVYMDMGDSLFSATQLFQSNGNENRERYIVMNGTPITTRVSKINKSPLDVIDEIYKIKIQEYHSIHALNTNSRQQSTIPPFVLINEDWSAIFKIDTNQIMKENENNIENSDNVNGIDNYIVLARKNAGDHSYVYELKFDHALDIFNVLLEQEGDVECSNDEIINRYPTSRRKFCLTELTSEKVISNIIIYEGNGDPAMRMVHYKEELDRLNYQLEALNNISTDRSILFAKNGNKNLTIFTYRSEEKVLDILQSQY
ncbi:MAG: hypothetical protein OEQ24_10780 [Gammaproteobacteria bacterium]|nr:hypothetical protein [Gammaproteobacteria bacterium]